MNPADQYLLENQRVNHFYNSIFCLLGSHVKSLVG